MAFSYIPTPLISPSTFKSPQSVSNVLISPEESPHFWRLTLIHECHAGHDHAVPIAELDSREDSSQSYLNPHHCAHTHAPDPGLKEAYWQSRQILALKPTNCSLRRIST